MLAPHPWTTAFLHHTLTKATQQLLSKLKREPPFKKNKKQEDSRLVNYASPHEVTLSKQMKSSPNPHKWEPAISPNTSTKHVFYLRHSALDSTPIDCAHRPRPEVLPLSGASDSVGLPGPKYYSARRVSQPASLHHWQQFLHQLSVSLMASSLCFLSPSLSLAFFLFHLLTHSLTPSLTIRHTDLFSLTITPLSPVWKHLLQ